MTTMGAMVNPLTAFGRERVYFKYSDIYGNVKEINSPYGILRPAVCGKITPSGKLDYWEVTPNRVHEVICDVTNLTVDTVKGSSPVTLPSNWRIVVWTGSSRLNWISVGALLSNNLTLDAYSETLNIFDNGDHRNRISTTVAQPVDWAMFTWCGSYNFAGYYYAYPLDVGRHIYVAPPRASR